MRHEKISFVAKIYAKQKSTFILNKKYIYSGREAACQCKQAALSFDGLAAATVCGAQARSAAHSWCEHVPEKVQHCQQSIGATFSSQVIQLYSESLPLME